MKSLKVRLYIRVLTVGGRSVFAKPVWNKNRTLKAGFADVDSTHHPEAVYYLRYLRNGNRVWQAVGREPDAAIMALRKTEHELRAASLGLTVVKPSIPSEMHPDVARISLQTAIQEYLKDLKRFKASGTVKGAEHMLMRFGTRFEGRFVNEICRIDLLDHIDLLKSNGLSHRTISNHLIRIGAFLRAYGVVGLLSATDKPSYEEKEVESYLSEELERLFASANPEERLIFEFFLGTGLREKEVMFTTWRNINFNDKIVSVRSKPDMGFMIKDKQERSVPVPDALIAALAERKKRSSSMLVFPGKDGKPNGHFLRMLQKLAHRAKLNCGECVTKAGKSCDAHPVCCHWGLHKFRKTFATMHSEAGVSARTIQTWLGHSDLTSTLRYLASASLKSLRTRDQVNATFAPLNLGGGA